MKRGADAPLFLCVSLPPCVPPEARGKDNCNGYARVGSPLYGAGYPGLDPGPGGDLA